MNLTKSSTSRLAEALTAALIAPTYIIAIQQILDVLGLEYPTEQEWREGDTVKMKYQYDWVIDYEGAHEDYCVLYTVVHAELNKREPSALTKAQGTFIEDAMIRCAPSKLSN